MFNNIISYLFFQIFHKTKHYFFDNLYIYYNHLKLINQKVVYASRPIVRGKLYMKNNGQCLLGKNIVFNSSFDSNPIGLSKVCSIYVNHNACLSIDDNSGFSGVSIFCSKEIRIGKFLFCGGNVNIWDTDFHSLDFIERNNSDESNVRSIPIIIGDNVFIGANSIILKGVEIGNNSIIGAGSIITNNIPANQIWAGNPAKFIKLNLSF